MTQEEKKILLNLVCQEQIKMIIEDSSQYSSDYYRQLEKIKVGIKDLIADK